MRLRATALAVLSLAIALVACAPSTSTRAEHHMYSAGENVSLDSGAASFVVPANHNALYSIDASLPMFGNPSVSISQRLAEKLPVYSTDLLSIGVGSQALAKSWDAKAQRMQASADASGTPYRFETVPLPNGWTANVTTRTFLNIKKRPTDMVWATLSKSDSRPLLVQAYYVEGVTESSTAPDPRQSMTDLLRVLKLKLR